jgi:hypothetical protein
VVVIGVNVSILFVTFSLGTFYSYAFPSFTVPGSVFVVLWGFGSSTILGSVLVVLWSLGSIAFCIRTFISKEHHQHNVDAR